MHVRLAKLDTSFAVYTSSISLEQATIKAAIGSSLKYFLFIINRFGVKWLVNKAPNCINLFKKKNFDIYMCKVYS